MTTGHDETKQPMGRPKLLYSYVAELSVLIHNSSNRTIGGGVMMSYRFFKMAPVESEMYFRV